MVLYLRKWTKRAKFMLLFTVCTFLLYHAMLLLAEWVEPAPKYKEPAGRAVKAFRHQPVSIGDRGTMAERLRLFYWYGE